MLFAFIPISAGHEEKRKRFIQPDELPIFFRALAEEQNATIRDYIWLSLFTGARRSNVQAMGWTEINFKRAVWTIPRTKNEDEHTITLTEAALVILKRRKKSAQCEWVFPGRGKTGHLQEPKTCWK